MPLTHNKPKTHTQQTTNNHQKHYQHIHTTYALSFYWRKMYFEQPSTSPLEKGATAYVSRDVLRLFLLEFMYESSTLDIRCK